MLYAHARGLACHLSSCQGTWAKALGNHSEFPFLTTLGTAVANEQTLTSLSVGVDVGRRRRRSTESPDKAQVTRTR